MIRSAYFIYMRQDQQLTGTGFKSEVAHSSQSINMPNSEWLHFAERSGRRGREWAEEYRRHSSKVELGAHALQQMRAGHLEQGGGLLREFVGEVESVDGEPASVRAVLDRYRHGIEGYYLYCRGEFAGAEQCMRVAHNAVARALNKAEWLLLLAVHCTEFRMHQARIARNQRRWPVMQACIAQVRAMMCDRLPLCEPEDGRKIWWSGFHPFFAALAPLTEEETRFAHTLLDPQERERLFNQFVRGMLRSPGNSASYPAHLGR
jgi:hypothetical protein